MSNKARQTRKEIAKAMTNLDAYVEKDELLNEAVTANFDAWINDAVSEIGVERDTFIQVLKRDGIWPRVSRFIYEQNLSTKSTDEQNTSFIESYIQRRGWRESSVAKHYLTALNNSTYALWEIIDRSEHRILDVKPYASSDEPLSIVDGHSGLLALSGDCICGRLLTIGTKHYFAEGKLLLPKAEVPGLLQSIEKLVAVEQDQFLTRTFFRHWAVASYNKALTDQERST